jgi:hypothetical protein
MKCIRLLKNILRAAPRLSGMLIGIPVALYTFRNIHIPIVHADTANTSIKQKPSTSISQFLTQYPNTLIALKNSKTK